MNTSMLFARLVAAHLDACAGRAVVRRLGAADVVRALRVHAEAVALHPTETVVTRMVGGIVANNYRYAADADVVEFLTEPSGATTYRAHRGSAPKRPYGRGEIMSVHARRMGQVQGRRLSISA